MGILDKFVLMICCVAETYMLFDFFNSYYSVKQKWNQKNLIRGWSMLALVMLYLINLFANPYFNLICVPILFFAYTSILFTGSWQGRLITLLIAFSVFLGCEFLFVILLEIPSSYAKKTSVLDLSQMVWHMLTMKLLAYIIFTIIKQFVSKLRKVQKGINGKVFLAYLCVPIASFCIMLITYYSGVDFTASNQIKIMMTVSFAFILVGNMLLFYTFNKYAEEAYTVLQQRVIISRKEMEQKHYQQVYVLNQKYKGFIHDTNHYLKAIGELAKENHNEKIIHILSELSIEIENSETQIYSINPVINSLLSEKRVRAEKNSMKFDVYLEPYILIDYIADIDLIAMLGNLLDNAFDAAEKCEFDRSVQVRLYMENAGNYFVIKIVNRFANDVVCGNNGFISTKKESGIHGIGVKSVESAAEKYGGYLEYNVENDYFEAILIFPTSNRK